MLENIRPIRASSPKSQRFNEKQQQLEIKAFFKKLKTQKTK